MLQKLFPQTVKNRILLVMTAVMLILVGLPSALFYQSYMESMIASQMQVGQSVYKQVLNTLRKRSENMGLLAISVAQMPRVQEYLYLEDRGTLLKIMMPLWKTLHQDYGVNVFHFHEKPAISFLRLQNPKKFGDDLSGFRKTVLTANKERKMVIALEKGKAGLSNRAVMPVFYEGEHVGSVEFGLPINDGILESIKEQIGSNISIIVPEGDGFKYQAKTHSLTIPAKKIPFLKKMMQSDKMVTKRVTKNGRELVTTYGPIKDYSGAIVAVLAVPLDITAEMSKARSTIVRILLIAGTILLLSLVGMLFFFQKMVNNPVNSLKDILEKASGGDLRQDKDTQNIQRSRKMNKNEFVELGRYVTGLISSIRNMVKEINVNSHELNQSASMLTSISRELATGTEATAGRVENLAQAAGEMSQNMTSVASATEQAASNVSAMTERTEGINSTIAEIQTSTETAKEITGQAVGEALEVSRKMNELGDAAHDIGKVTEAITEISEQTNLLALNATIEAARAGEAGKGFAVVANEIKELAKQTAEATGEISSRIQAIQNSTGIAVEGIEKISGIIQNIDMIVTGIASSLDEQGKTLGELTASIQQIGQGINDVSENVTQSSAVSRDIATDVEEVNNATIELSHTSVDLQQSGEELKKLAEDLQHMVNKFKLS